MSEDLWPFWPRVYAQGDPLPSFAPPAGRTPQRFDEGDTLPEEYRGLSTEVARDVAAFWRERLKGVLPE